MATKKGGATPRKAAAPNKPERERSSYAKRKGNKKPARRQGKITLKEFIPAWLNNAKTYNAPKTVKGKIMYARHYIRFFGATPLADIAQADVESYVAARKQQNAGTPTVNRELTNLKHLFNIAIGHGYVEKNPGQGVRHLPEARKPLNIPTPEEIRHFLAWCLEHDNLLFNLTIIAVNTGVRKGDLLNIKGDDIDVERRVLKVSVSKTGAVQYIPLNDAALVCLARLKTPGYIFLLRTFRSTHYTLCREIQDVLRNAGAPLTAKEIARKIGKPGRTVRSRLPYMLRLDEIKRADRGKYTVGDNDVTETYSNIDDVPLQSFRRRFSRAKRLTGLNFRWHDLRHAFAVYTLDACGNVRTVQDLLGHASLATTQRYLTVLDHQRRKAVEALTCFNV